LTEQAKLTVSENDDGGVPEGIEAYDGPMGRAHALLEAMGQQDIAVRGDVPDEDVDDANVEASEIPAKGTKSAPKAAAEKLADAADPSPADSPKAQALAERRERERRDHQRRMAERAIEEERAAVQRERAEMARQLEQVKPLLTALQDPDALLELLSDRVDPEKLSAAIPTFLSDEARNKARLRRLQQEQGSELEQVRKEIAELRAEKQREAQQAALAQKRQEVYQQFASEVEASAEQAPGVAKLLKRNPARLYKLADEAADDLTREGVPWTMADVIERLHKDLYADEADAGSTDKSTSSSRKQSAAAKANPLGNRVSSDRATMRDGDDAEARAPSFDDRVRSAMRALTNVPIKEVVRR
jgi:hypothetical protein